MHWQRRALPVVIWSSKILLNLKQVGSAVHLLQYIGDRAYLILNVFHQQDLAEILM